MFRPTVDQANVYENVAAPLVRDVMKGYNGTLLAYGQTGTGKTYTMRGNGEKSIDQGVIPRCLDDIFDIIDKDKRHYTWTVSVTYVQMYCETIQDLLRPESRNLSIREDR